LRKEHLKMSTKQLIALGMGAAMSALIMSPVFAAGNPTAGERPKEYGGRLVAA
jgi:hypothetical protein